MSAISTLSETCTASKVAKSFRVGHCLQFIINLDNYAYELPRDIGPRKFFGIPVNIQDSVAKEENIKQILTKVK